MPIQPQSHVAQGPPLCSGPTNQLGPGPLQSVVTGPQGLPQGMGGYLGDQRNKGDGVIADPATELDPTIKPGSLIYPQPDAKTIGDQIISILPDQVKGLVDYITTMLGENGPQVASKTIWKGDGKERIDVENPNPGQRPGQIHYQDNAGNKYLYDPTTNSFPDAPNSVNKLLSDPGFNAAIQKGLNKYLGGN